MAYESRPAQGTYLQCLPQGLDNLQLNDKWKNLVKLYEAGKATSRTGFVLTEQARQDIQFILAGHTAA